MYSLLPSLLSADSQKLINQIQILEDAGVDGFHIDMMDAMYVSRSAFSLAEVYAVRRATKLPLDIHVMTLEPERVAQKVVNFDVQVVSLHYEACNNIVKALKDIRACGTKAGVVLKPETPIEVLDDEILSIASVVQLMSVPPGAQEKQIFYEETLDRIKETKTRISAIGCDAIVQVDGDINHKNVCSVIEAGADSLVVGSALFCGDLVENVKAIKRLIKSTSTELKQWVI